MAKLEGSDRPGLVPEAAEDKRREGIGPVCINDALTDDELMAVLERLEKEEDRDGFGLVCKRWLRLQSSERRRLRARAGPAMLRRMADRFPGVLHLDLSQSASRSFFPGVTDSDLAVIAAGFKNLRVLDLQNCKGVGDVGMITLSKGIPSLQSLDVSNCRKITDKGLMGIAVECQNLRALNLSCCKTVTDDLLKALSKSCLHLEELSLVGCNNITDSGLSSLADGCLRIKSLDVSKCTKIGDVGVSRLAEVSSISLKILKVQDCYKVGDKSILSLSQFCCNIETLVIGGCRDVSDELLKVFALACSGSLRNIGMDWCLNVTDSTVNALLLNCRHLLALDIGCCDKVTDLAFEALGNGEFKSDLRFLKVSNCTKITVSGVGTILQFCKSLQYLDLRACPQISRFACEQSGLQFPEGCKTNFDDNLSESDAMIDIFFRSKLK